MEEHQIVALSCIDGFTYIGTSRPGVGGGVHAEKDGNDNQLVYFLYQDVVFPTSHFSHPKHLGIKNIQNEYVKALKKEIKAKNHDNDGTDSPRRITVDKVVAAKHIGLVEDLDHFVHE